MVTVHGSVGEFTGVAEERPSYIERPEFYFTANDVDEEGKKHAILLSGCGSATYSLIRSLVAPKKASEMSFQDIVEKVKEHFNPRPSPIVQRYKVNSRSQLPGETIASYVAELRQLSEHCGYRDKLKEMLRDRLVCGVVHARCQQRLLAEVELTFDKAFKIAQAMELAECDSQQLQQQEPTPSLPIQKVEENPHKEKKVGSYKPCYRCGGKHEPHHCRFLSVNCHACGKKGHISKVCRSKSKIKRSVSGGDKSLLATKAVVSSVSTTGIPEYSLYPVRSDKNSPLQTVMSINGKAIEMEVDTGAAVTVISEETLADIWRPRHLATQTSSLPSECDNEASYLYRIGDTSGRYHNSDRAAPEAGNSSSSGCGVRHWTKSVRTGLASQNSARLEKYIVNPSGGVSSRRNSAS